MRETHRKKTAVPVSIAYTDSIFFLAFALLVIPSRCFQAVTLLYPQRLPLQNPLSVSRKSKDHAIALLGAFVVWSI